MYSTLTMKKLKSTSTWCKTHLTEGTIYLQSLQYILLCVTLLQWLFCLKISPSKRKEINIITYDYFLPVWTFFMYGMNEEIKSTDAHLFICLSSYIRLNCQFIIFLHHKFLTSVNGNNAFYILLPTRLWRYETCHCY